MQKTLKFVVVMAFLTGGVFIFSSKSTAAMAASAGSEPLESPRSLYRTHCASCHGNDGKSQTAKGRRLEANDLSTADVKGDSQAKIVRVISNGKGDMPAFKKKLSAAQMASIAGYLKTL